MFRPRPPLPRRNPSGAKATTAVTRVARLVLLLISITPISLAQPDAAVPEVEGSFHGFPVLRDSQGKKLADGEFLQWFEHGKLQIRNTYDFGHDHRVVETAVFGLEPFAQEQWSWRESTGTEVLREYAVDLRTGQASARKSGQGEPKEWQETLRVEPGRTFAGVGFTTAIRHFRLRLLRGETLELRAIGFTPKPRGVTVEVRHAGRDEMTMSARRITGDHFLVRPKIPAIARAIMDISDTHIWLTHPAPAGFLRWEGAFAEPDEPIVRVDLLPGEPSGPAQPQARGPLAPTGR
jgi:hypothetical protein